MTSNLYTPGTIGGMAVKNRIVMTAMHTALSENGEVGPALLEYFRRRAAGGAGLLVVGAAGIDPVRVNTHGVIGLYDDRFINGLSRLAEEIHRHDCRCAAQLFHPGRYARSSEYGGQTAVAPSAIPSRFTRETPRELTVDEIRDIAGYYIAAARRAREAGFDGVEITAASGYLPAQFLSSVTNHRMDPYGGPLQARLTFLRVLIAGIKDSLGENYPLIVRIGANDFMEGGNTSLESLKIAVELEHAGADAVSVTGGWHESPVPQLTMDVPPGFLAYQAKRIRKAVGIPLIVSNRMTPKIAEELVDSESVDFVGFGRGLLADPDMPAKAAEGRYGTVRPCIACNQGCMDRIFFGRTISCAVNPEAGREAELAENRGTAASRDKRLSILVIGGGIAGLQYALTAADRGHRPTVWEKDSRPGGLALIAAGLRERSEITLFVSWLVRACRDRGVPVVTERTAAAENVRSVLNAGEFDRVVLATGATAAAASDLDTDGSVPIIHAWDVLRGRAVPGRRILISGGDAAGVWAALRLASRGAITAEQFHFLIRFQAERLEPAASLLNDVSSEITVVENGREVGEHISPSSRWVYRIRMGQLGVKTLTKHEVLRIRGGSVSVKAEDGSTRDIPADAVVETRTLRSKGDFGKLPPDVVGRLSLLGGQSGRGNIPEAVRTAFEEAETL